uniref:Uncharacterized protein n=1 Tax=Acrobeloides nanus TaxID=290746 RepID=A0A914DY07_9BILA
MSYLIQLVLSKIFGNPTAPTNSTTSTNFSVSVPINNNQTTKNTALNFYGPVDVKISNNNTNVHGSENKINQTNKQAGHTPKSELKPASSSQPIQGPCTQGHSRAVRPNQNIKMLENGVVVLDPRLLDLASANDLTKFTRSIKKG